MEFIVFLALLVAAVVATYPVWSVEDEDDSSHNLIEPPKPIQIRTRWCHACEGWVSFDDPNDVYGTLISGGFNIQSIGPIYEPGDDHPIPNPNTNNVRVRA